MSEVKTTLNTVRLYMKLTEFSIFNNLAALMYCTQSENLLSDGPESPGCIGSRRLHVSTAQRPLQIQQQRRLLVVTTRMKHTRMSS